jgi:hypothetical protein
MNGNSYMPSFLSAAAAMNISRYPPGLGILATDQFIEASGR